MNTTQEKKIGMKIRKSKTSLNSYNIKHPLNESRIKVSLIAITPTMAKNLLDTNHNENRDIKVRVVNDYADQMKKGLWREISGESLKISETTKLIDGQHRLNAIIQSNVTVTMLVIENIPEESMAAIDDGAKRTLSDSLKIRGLINPSFNQKMVASAIIALDVLRNSAKNNLPLNVARRTRNSSIVSTLEFSKKIPDLYEVMNEFNESFNLKNIKKIIPIGTSAIPLYYIFSKIDKEFTDNFFSTIETGIPNDGLGINSPSFIAYNTILNYKMKKLNLRLTDYYELFIWAMEKSKTNTKSKQVYRRKGFLITNDYLNSNKVINLLNKLN
jgi:hypothetical protein